VVQAILVLPLLSVFLSFSNILCWTDSDPPHPIPFCQRRVSINNIKCSNFHTPLSSPPPRWCLFTPHPSTSHHSPYPIPSRFKRRCRGTDTVSSICSSTLLSTRPAAPHPISDKVFYDVNGGGGGGGRRSNWLFSRVRAVCSSGGCTHGP